MIKISLNRNNIEEDGYVSMYEIRWVNKKIQPFLKGLEARGLYDEFDWTEWIRKDTEAWKFAKKNLAKDERDILRTMVYLDMLLGS